MYRHLIPTWNPNCPFILNFSCEGGRSNQLMHFTRNRCYVVLFYEVSHFETDISVGGEAFEKHVCSHLTSGARICCCGPTSVQGMHEWMHACTNECTNERTNECANECTHAQMNARMNARMHKLMHEWRHAWVREWMHEWISECTHECTNESTIECTNECSRWKTILRARGIANPFPAWSYSFSFCYCEFIIAHS